MKIGLPKWNESSANDTDNTQTRLCNDDDVLGVVLSSAKMYKAVRAMPTDGNELLVQQKHCTINDVSALARSNAGNIGAEHADPCDGVGISKQAESEMDSDISERAHALTTIGSSEFAKSNASNVESDLAMPHANGIVLKQVECLGNAGGFACADFNANGDGLEHTRLLTDGTTPSCRGSSIASNESERLTPETGGDALTREGLRIVKKELRSSPHNEIRPEPVCAKLRGDGGVLKCRKSATDRTRPSYATLCKDRTIPK